MTNRLYFIDNLRVFCIIIVVFIHTAVTYSCIGRWYYNEPSLLGGLDQLFFYLFQSHAQAFSMSLFFLIAGYFIPDSLNRKGRKKFILDRLYRLGIPVLVFIFILHPICVKIAHPEADIASMMLGGIKNGEFLSWTGPLWFALTLLFFSIIYSFFYRPALSVGKNMNITAPKIISLIGLITLLAFCIRIFMPIGTSWMNLQFCYFAAYVVMFYIGTLVAKYNLLQKLTYSKGRNWLILAFVIGLPIWFSAVFFGKAADGSIHIEGGLATASFVYALWESFFCVAFIVGLFGITQAKFNMQNKLMKFLSANTFGIYVFHAPVLIALSVLLKEVHIQVLAKFLLTGTLAVMGSLCVAWMVRQIPYVGKYFN